MPKLKSRMMFDVVLTIMLIFEMFYQLTGNLLHELVGALFFICIITHLLFSSRWIKDTAKSVGKKKMNSRRKGLAIVAALLFVDILALGASSAIISNTLWSAGIDLTALNPNGIWYPIHTASSYGLCVLTLAHLAMHWTSMAKVMKIEYNPARRKAIGQCVNVAVGLGALALGVAGVKQVGQALPLELLDGDSSALADSGSATSPSANASPMSMCDTADPIANAEAEAQTDQKSQARDRKRDKANDKDKNTDSTTNKAEDQVENTSSSNDADEEQHEEAVEYYDEEPSYDEPEVEEEESYESSSSQDLGTCPLCPKHCPLSSPRCNKPYEAGLI